MAVQELPPSCGALPALASSPPSCGIFFSHFSCSDPDEEAKRNLPYPMDKQIRISPGRRQDDDDPTAGRKFRLACGLRALVEAWQLAVTEHWPSGATLDDNPLTKEA